MIQLDKTFAKKWGRIKNEDGYCPYHLDVQCPNPRCKRSLVNHSLEWRTYGSFAFAHLKCAACDQFIRFFLIDPPRAIPTDDLTPSRLLMVPPQAIEPSFSDEIANLSPDYVKIYTQAAKAEFLKLDELTGVGYRKALEFLIKDYLCDLYPDQSAEIKAKFLGNCIRDHITDPRIRDCAQRTAWLANDETHYVRRWHNHDLDDLKLLLELTNYWISSEILTREYKARLR